MKFTLSSLKEYFETSASLHEICEKLTNIGLEVESIIDQSEILGEFSVAQIIDCKNHENSNKLKICSVCIDEKLPPIQIVCGASNARNNLKVAFAKINSVIPKNQMVIKKAKIAGIESNGMLCSASELQINDDDFGIIEVENKWPIGTKISEVYQRNDAVIEIYATPNRGDCLGVFGIARDLSATGLGKLKIISTKNLENHFNFELKIDINNYEACPFIVYRQIKNIKNCPSPQWLKDKLTMIGINPISAIVDITNFVMHLTAQPLHAYDKMTVKGNLTIDLQKESSEMIALNDQKYIIEENILSINDDEKILSIAGVIGSKSSSCSNETSEVLLEAGNFNPTNIAYSGRKLNIITESRHRFERGSDPYNCELAIDLASQMILEICGNQKTEISNKKIIGKINSPRIIEFEINHLKKLIGIDIPKNIIVEILNKLGFEIKEHDNSLRLTVPSYRNDISISVDIVEEIIRIYGFENINKQSLEISYCDKSTTNNSYNLKPTRNNDANNYQQNKISFNSSQNLNYYSDQIRSKLISRGLIETINWSFIEDKIVDLFCNRDENLLLKNPVSIEMNYLRPTLAIGLLSSYKRNSLRNFQNLSIFEIGNIFKNNQEQKLSICGLRVGKNKENNHYRDERDFDVFDVKKDLYVALESLNIKTSNLEITNENLRYFHPHRNSSLKFGKNIIANFGELHPAINQYFSIKQRLNYFEIFVDDQFISKKLNGFKAFLANDFPIVERDFAVIVDDDLAVAKLQKAIIDIDKNLIKEVNIFDVFINPAIGENKKSVALNVKIQDNKTLTSTEIDEISKKIITTLGAKFNADLRS
jgi:phenylalanyl-tRNA synthetase beta chain